MKFQRTDGKDKDFDMRLKRAECPVKVAEIVEKTIKAVYPHYYPSGAVQFFLDLHNERRIREALAREDMVFRKYQAVHIDASFPAESMYLKRGYRIKTYEKIETGGGDYLCYHTMEKAADEKG